MATRDSTVTDNAVCGFADDTALVAEANPAPGATDSLAQQAVNRVWSFTKAFGGACNRVKTVAIAVGPGPHAPLFFPDGAPVPTRTGGAYCEMHLGTFQHPSRNTSVVEKKVRRDVLLQLEMWSREEDLTALERCYIWNCVIIPRVAYRLALEDFHPELLDSLQDQGERWVKAAGDYPQKPPRDFLHTPRIGLGMHCIQPAIYANQVQVIQRLRFSSNNRICQWVKYALSHPVEMIPWYPKALQKLDLAKCKQRIWTWGQICGTQPAPQGQQVPPDISGKWFDPRWQWWYLVCGGTMSCHVATTREQHANSEHVQWRIVRAVAH